MRVRLASFFYIPGRLTNSEKIVQNGQETVAFIATNVLHVIRSFTSSIINLANFVESCRYL